jgi:hypothetical protein
LRGGAVVTNAQLIAYDGFSTTDYATGTNPSANPTGGGQGPGWASPWMPGIFGEQNPITSATGYNSPAGAMPTVGNHVQALNTSDPVTSYMSRTINLPALAEGDSIWFSYQAAVIDANSAAISSNLTLFSSGDFYRMTVWNGPSTQISIEAFDQASSLINLPTPANLTDPYFIVTQILRNPDVTPGNANLTFNLYTVADPNAPVSGSNPLITPTPFLSLTGDGLAYLALPHLESMLLVVVSMSFYLVAN